MNPNIDNEYYFVDNRGFFKRPFSSKGRIGRREYIVSWLMYFVISMFVARITYNSDGSSNILLIGISLVSWGFILMQSIKRCHDRNQSGIFILIPFYGIFLLFAPGTKGQNDYGNSPKFKYKESHTEIE